MVIAEKQRWIASKFARRDDKPGMYLVQRTLGTGLDSGQIGIRTVVGRELGLFGLLSHFAAHDLFVALLDLCALARSFRCRGFWMSRHFDASFLYLLFFPIHNITENDKTQTGIRLAVRSWADPSDHRQNICARNEHDIPIWFIVVYNGVSSYPEIFS
jgi:hypothetical protein